MFYVPGGAPSCKQQRGAPANRKEIIGTPANVNTIVYALRGYSKYEARSCSAQFTVFAGMHAIPNSLTTLECFPASQQTC